MLLSLDIFQSSVLCCNCQMVSVPVLTSSDFVFADSKFKMFPDVPIRVDYHNPSIRNCSGNSV